MSNGTTYTFDLSGATGSTNPAQQSPAGGGFQLPEWLTGVFQPGSGVATVGAGVANFLASDAGACYQAFPPFSGMKAQRQECLRRVAAGGVYQVRPYAQGSVSQASLANIAAIGLVGFLGYQLLKK